LKEQKTLDLLIFFSEDFEVIKKYFLDNVFFFWFEMPKFLLLLLLLFFSFFSWVGLTLIKKFPILKNKVKSFLKIIKKI